MWRFILLSFVFMGWVFYQLSGGSEYEPVKGSVQNPISTTAIDQPKDVADGSDQATTAGSETKVASASDVQNDAGADELKALLDNVKPGEETPDATVASADAAAADEATDTVVTEVRFGSALDAFKTGGVKADAGLAANKVAGGDLRKVAGNQVNLRSGPGKTYAPVDRLANGTEVEVIATEGDWVQLRVLSTGTTGWMADWLVTAAND